VTWAGRRTVAARWSIALVAVFVSTVAWIARSAAQIYEWRDEQGDRHFTSSLESIPESQRPSAKLLVKARPTPEKAESPPPPPPRREPPEAPQPHAPEPPTETREFEAGWIEGFNAAMEQVAAMCTTRPPAVIEHPVPLSPALLYDPAGLYYRPPHQGTVTVPFDQGRTRGLTRRQQIQERRLTPP